MVLRLELGEELVMFSRETSWETRGASEYERKGEFWEAFFIDHISSSRCFWNKELFWHVLVCGGTALDSLLGVLIVIRLHVSSGCGRFLPPNVGSCPVTESSGLTGTALAQNGGHCCLLLSSDKGQLGLTAHCLDCLSSTDPSGCVRGWVWVWAPLKSLPSLKRFELWFPIAVSFSTCSLLLPIFQELLKFPDLLMVLFVVFQWYFGVFLCVFFFHWVWESLIPLCAQSLSCSGRLGNGALKQILHPEILMEIRNLSNERQNSC